MKVDCDELPGKLRTICDGTATKGKGKRFSQAERVELIAKRLRVDPSEIELPEAGEDEPEEPEQKSQIGTRLKAIIKREFGAVACKECRIEMKRLNGMTAAEVETEKDSIAERMAERAKRIAPRWWQRLGAKLAPGEVKRRCLAMIEEALSE